MSKQKGRLFLLPSPIEELGIESIPPEAIRILHSLDHFIVERARTSRRYISLTRPVRPIDVLQIEEMPEDMSDQKVIDAQLQPLLEGHDIGLLSEAGLPAIADPGNRYILTAHRFGIRVVPVSGPSSIMMALMASGLEGQRFAFHGYLTAKKDELEKQLKELERRADRDDATQIWIEAPYRNKQILEAAALYLDLKREFCIAAGIGNKNGFVLTRNIASWKRSGWPEIHKIPAVFLLK
jgi:16S rRNA (cytidine1402-2'-O)-methyltransferase